MKELIIYYYRECETHYVIFGSWAASIVFVTRKNNDQLLTRQKIT